MTDSPDSVKGRDLDFRDPKSVMQLTKTLLKLDFGIKIDLPDDRLCPPVCTGAFCFLESGKPMLTTHATRSPTGTTTYSG